MNRPFIGGQGLHLLHCFICEKNLNGLCDKIYKLNSGQEICEECFLNILYQKDKEKLVNTNE